jgi:hypothetical protein
MVALCREREREIHMKHKLHFLSSKSCTTFSFFLSFFFSKALSHKVKLIDKIYNVFILLTSLSSHYLSYIHIQTHIYVYMELMFSSWTLSDSELGVLSTLPLYPISNQNLNLRRNQTTRN